MNKHLNILVTDASQDYELMDSGFGEKLERFGSFVLSRPDPQALWEKSLTESEWKKADAHFRRDEIRGEWLLKSNVPHKWEMGLNGLRFWIKTTAFKHTGLFPEQAENWKWLESIISRTGAEIEILNLFGYTGGATLTCAKSGAKVVHVDGSRSVITWARENSELSGLADKPIRWIMDDARSFVKREIKRGRKYAGIIMDPPSFGHGPENELWKIEDDLMMLLADCLKILDEKPLFFLLNGYSAGYSALAYENILKPLVLKYGGDIEIGELAIRESVKKEIQNDRRILPCGIFARWTNKM